MSSICSGFPEFLWLPKGPELTKTVEPSLRHYVFRSSGHRMLGFLFFFQSFMVPLMIWGGDGGERRRRRTTGSWYARELVLHPHSPHPQDPTRARFRANNENWGKRCRVPSEFVRSTLPLSVHGVAVYSAFPMSLEKMRGSHPFVRLHIHSMLLSTAQQL
jgi:hypothetical protein